MTTTTDNERRRSAEKPLRPEILLTEKGQDSAGEPVLVPNDDGNLIGLALSGGGVRSAAFCLGALQALDEARVRRLRQTRSVELRAI